MLSKRSNIYFGKNSIVIVGSVSPADGGPSTENIYNSIKLSIDISNEILGRHARNITDLFSYNYHYPDQTPELVENQKAMLCQLFDKKICNGSISTGFKLIWLSEEGSDYVLSPSRKIRSGYNSIGGNEIKCPIEISDFELGSKIRHQSLKCL